MGDNVIQGLGEFADPAIATQALTKPDEAAAPSTKLLHARLGTNGEPVTKLKAFEAWLRDGMTGRVDFALLKFCYVDVLTDTAADQLLATYAETMARIRAEHPRLRLAHCTIPLRAVPQGAYAALRRALGHRHIEYVRNAARERFNDQLRHAMKTEKVFDIARIEAGLEAHSPPPARGNLALLRKYTSDGGHLNELGRRIVASRFAAFLDGLNQADGR